MATKLEFIATLPIFAELSDTAQSAIARVATEYSFTQNAVIAYQRDVANNFYMVKEGRLFVRGLDAHGIVRETRSYTPGPRRRRRRFAP